MTNFSAIAAASNSLERLVNTGFAAQSPVATGSARAMVTAFEKTPGDADADPRPAPPCLSIFLYRVDINRSMRAAWSAVGAGEGNGQLALDLHYLMTPWGRNAVEEQLILGRAMQLFEQTPILSGPMLQGIAGRPDAGLAWDVLDSLQIVIDELSNEAMMRIFDSLAIDYRLSVPYIVRIARLVTAKGAVRPPVTSAEFPAGKRVAA